jgi:hypothetical protein
MKSKFLILGSMCAASLVAACHHDSNGSTTTTPPPTNTPPSTTMALDTAQVLALAQVTSETSAPFAVNGGAYTQTDTSENTAPITVNGN